MDLYYFLKNFPKFFSFLAWPSFTLVYPLCASIWAIERDKGSNYQQCLTYWVLFSITTVLESVLAKLLVWFPFWPYVRGIVTLLLVTPYFRGASHVYTHFIRPCISVNFQVFDSVLIPVKTGYLSNEPNEFLDTSERFIEEKVEDELDKVVIYEVESKPNCDTTESAPSSPKKVQKEWSCALCLISTSSEKCLRNHLKGTKHNAELENLCSNVVVMDEIKISSKNKSADKIALLENFDEIARINLKKISSILNPVARSIRWCTWKKPKVGWTKLNTDGSIDRGNAGFGGLLRDYKGDPICGYVSKAKQNDIFLVELWAIWRGLVLALGLGILEIWIESDSLSVVKTINKEQPYGGKASSCLKDIWALLKKLEKYKVSHSWRETNRAADYLAKMEVLGSDVVIWPVDFPNNLCEIIKDDGQGKRYRRG